MTFFFVVKFYHNLRLLAPVFECTDQPMLCSQLLYSQRTLTFIYSEWPHGAYIVTMSLAVNRAI